MATHVLSSPRTVEELSQKMPLLIQFRAPNNNERIRLVSPNTEEAVTENKSEVISHSLKDFVNYLMGRNFKNAQETSSWL